ncbi:IclR family transcriptional regulator [Pararhodobacter zhoushanensis]|uniref:IclR family transcriptional regulator n=1 Tax=Pararhodobacter zhoushanensis TaxID=2479545 RepID=A0ABT3H4K8_9RHOB|nr:IclR family transcriptional regulator [Pararhodobacter zhoushanensis]MCW1934729.1 IclR family transcriptional regulator [Pararhodobacter zhoushanensis]
MTDEITQTRPVGALVHALSILRYLSARGRPEGVSVIARATGVNGSTCFNLLRTLVAEGLLVFDERDKTYRPGLGLVELAVGVLGANPADMIRPELERLSLQHSALMCLWHITGDDRIVLIERAYDPAATRVDLPMGKRLPAYSGGVGRALAAHRGLTRDALRAPFAALRWQLPPSFDSYADSVAEAARLGYAVDLGELYIGVDVVGSIVTDAHGTARYGVSSITLAGQIDATARHAIGEDIATTCRRIGGALFATPGPGAAVRQT